MKPRHRRSLLSGIAFVSAGALLAPTAATALPAQDAPVAPAATADLIISEYIEGSSNNKALEIYNGTGAEVDLSEYVVRVYSNGSSGPGTPIALGGTVAADDVFVLANSSWNLGYTPDQTSGSASWNGNDAVVLFKGETPIDSLGQVGVDPGTAWGEPPTTTLNATLVRQSDVCTGDTVVDDAFEPADEWTGLPIDDISDLGAHTANCGDVEPAGPVINEFSASTAGDDVEFLEVFGEPQTDYSHLSILQVEGDSTSTIGRVVSVHAVGTTDGQGLWLGDLPANALQNGTLSLLMIEGSVDVDTDLDTDDDGVLDVDLTIVDSVAVNDGGAGDVTYGGVTLAGGFDGVTFTPGGASRFPDGTDTDTVGDWVRNDFDLAGIPGYDGTPVEGEAYNTPGAPNQLVEGEEPPPPGGECGDPATAIGAVQGDGAASPIVGQTVTVEGVVIGDYQESGFNGYYLQDGGDDDPATSDGIFVYDPDAGDVVLGDRLRVTATVAEAFEQTQLSNPTVLECATDVDLPAATEVTFPVTDEDLESLEGMHVTFPESLAILEYFNYGRYGEIVMGYGEETFRQFQPTAVYPPYSSEAEQMLVFNDTHRITVDDGRGDQNPEFLLHPNGEQFTLENTFRGGDTVANLTGVMSYRNDAYKVQPNGTGADYEATNPRPEVPELGGSMQVASFNVLNYFTTLDARGANTPEELERQQTKIVAAIVEMDADVVGLIEIENNGDEAVGTLVDALNEAAGAGTYDFVSTGVIGTDEITTAFIYQPAAVTPVGDFAILTEDDDPRFLDSKNRPTLAQTFEENATGERVTVANNHLKSKGSSCDDVGDPEDPWAGNCNGVRTDAAEAMVDWLAGDPTEQGTDNILVIGDLNSYDKEDPIEVFLDAGYSDLLLDFGEGEFDYSYVFDGQLGYLDYALASEGLLDNVVDAATWKINADEPSVLDYDMTFKPDEQDALYEPNAYRSSDHDPVLVGLDLGAVEERDVVRLAGENRYETAAAVAQQYEPGVGTVFIATGDRFPDALTGSAKAGSINAPVLLTRSDLLVSATRAELERLTPARVVLLGDENAIDATVEAQVAALVGAGTEVERWAGDNRYETAAAVSAHFEASDVVYVAIGEDFPDALAGSARAGALDAPVLLVKEDAVPSATRGELERLDPSVVRVLGDRVTQDVLDTLAGYGDVERIYGENRYETAVEISQDYDSNDQAFVVNGLKWPDAVTAAALAAREEAPVLLTQQHNLPLVTEVELRRLDPETIWVLGDELSVSEQVEQELRLLP